MKKLLLWSLALLALLPLRVPIVAAGMMQEPGQRMMLAEADRRQQRRISLNEAVELVQSQTGGRVLQAQEVRGDGRDIYRIKVLTRQGEVRIVHVNAETGAIE